MHSFVLRLQRAGERFPRASSPLGRPVPPLTSPLTWLLALLLIIMLGGGGAVMGATVQLFQPSRSSVFFPDEPVRMRLVVLLDSHEARTLTRPSVAYSVKDYWGATVLEGEALLEVLGFAGGRADLEFDLPAEARGWFKVDLALVSGDVKVPLRNNELPTGGSYVTFAVVDPPRPGLQPDSFFGICEHQLDDTNAEIMRRAGIRSVRIDVFWGGIQSVSGGPFDWSRMDGIVEVAGRFGLDLLPIIDYTAPFAAEKLPGVKEGSPARYPPREEDWRRFVRALVERYRESVKAWEVWNEANIDHFWLGTAEHYSNLLRQAYEEIRAAAPSALVSIAGTSGVDLAWFHEVAAAGGGPYMDVVAVHPYRQPAPPEAGVTSDLVRVRNFANGLPPSAGGVAERPLWITEMGYHTLGNNAAVSEERQAQYLVRAMVQAWAAGVERFYWYEFADGGVNSGDQEANFGLVYHNLMPKPAYAAYAAMERLLGGADAPPRTLAFDDRRLRAYAFSVNGESIVVAWSIGGTHPVEWPAGGPVEVVDLMGARRTLEPVRKEDGEGLYVTVDLSDSPLYVMGLDLEAMEEQDIALISEDPLVIKGAPSAENSPNLVRNGSFEEAVSERALPTGWNLHISQNSAFSWERRVEPGEAPDGNAYLRLRNNSPLGPHVYGRVYQQLQVKPWTTYTITAKVRTQNNGRAWIGGGPNWAVRFHLPRDTGGEWQDFEGVFTTAAETTWELMILLEDVDESVDVDDLSVREGILPSEP